MLWGDSRESHVYQAKIAEQAERYEEMVEAMTKVAELGTDLTTEERNFLSVGYKNMTLPRRKSWRIIDTIASKEENNKSIIAKMRLDHVYPYKKKIEKELTDICNELLQLLDKHLIPAATSGESKVYYHKMKADYHRYLAECASNETKKALSESTLNIYKFASQLAVAELPPTHQIRLGLALNFSVFYFEIMNSTELACLLAKQAFDDAIADLDKLSEDNYKDSTLIMNLLRDNLTKWTRFGTESQLHGAMNYGENLGAEGTTDEDDS